MQGRNMIVHAALIGGLSYLIMRFGLKQGSVTSENRSIVIASAVLIYMICVGHDLPKILK